MITREIQRMGSRASVAAARAAAGIPADAPLNRHGQSCAEKVCVICGVSFLAQWSHAEKRKTCSRKCAAALKKQRSAGGRKGASNPNFRHGRRAGVRDRSNEPRWYSTMRDYCQSPSCLGARGCLAQHHICYAQTVGREDGDLFDPRNGMTLCTSCHLKHHNRHAVLPLTALPSPAFEYAAELLGPEKAYNYLQRRYAGDDPRLDALLGPA
jgi:hypothetical protein